MHVAPWPHFQDINLAAQDMYGNDLNYRVVNKPEWGTITKASSEAKFSAHFRYTPFQGHTGFDFFTFIASNAVMDSNLATVSLKVDTSLEPPPEEFVVNDSGADEAKTSEFAPQNMPITAEFTPKALPKTVSTLENFSEPAHLERTFVKMLSLVGEEELDSGDGSGDDDDDFDGEVNPLHLRSKSSDEPRSTANSFMLQEASATGPAPKDAPVEAAAAAAAAEVLPSAASQDAPSTAYTPQGDAGPLAAPVPAPAAAAEARTTDSSSGATAVASASVPTQPLSTSATSAVLLGVVGDSESTSNAMNGRRDNAATLPAVDPQVPLPMGVTAASAPPASAATSASEEESSDGDDDGGFNDDVRLTMDITSSNSMGFGNMDSDED